MREDKIELLVLRLTDRCNLACEYCYAARCEALQDMSFQTAKKAIDWCAKPGERLDIQFTGGEPLLCISRIREITEYLKRRNPQARISLQTNGTLLTDETCEFLKSIHCSLGISLDGIHEADMLRKDKNQQPSFSSVFRGIQKLKQYGMSCNLNAVVTSKNQDKLGELVDFAAFCGNIHGIGLDMFRPLGRGADQNLMPDPEVLQSKLQDMAERAERLRRLGVRIKIKELEKVRYMLSNMQTQEEHLCYCYAGTQCSVAVDPRGDIYPCASFVGQTAMRLGNLWTGYTKEAFDIRREIRTVDAGCTECPDFHLCRGGCPAGRIAFGKKNEADCLMHRSIIALAKKERCLDENLMSGGNR